MEATHLGKDQRKTSWVVQERLNAPDVRHKNLPHMHESWN